MAHFTVSSCQIADAPATEYCDLASIAPNYDTFASNLQNPSVMTALEVHICGQSRERNCNRCFRPVFCNIKTSTFCPKCRIVVPIEKYHMQRLFLSPNRITILKIVYYFAIDTPQYLTVRLLGDTISQSTVQRVYSVLTEVITSALQHNPITFRGTTVITYPVELEDELPEEPTNEVHVDEMKPGKKAKYNKGTSGQRGCNWLFGIKETNSKKCFAIMVQDRKKSTLQAIVNKHIYMDTHVNHDGWASYSFLQEQGYSHSVVNHSKEFKAADGTHTNGIEGFWGLLRQRISSRHGCPPSYVQNVVSEFCYRQTYSVNGSIWLKLIEDLSAA